MAMADRKIMWIFNQKTKEDTKNQRTKKSTDDQQFNSDYDQDTDICLEDPEFVYY
jgi:hypothetical protein